MILTRMFADYNEHEIHSALGYVTSNEFGRKSEGWNK